MSDEMILTIAFGIFFVLPLAVILAGVIVGAGETAPQRETQEAGKAPWAGRRPF